MEGIEIKNQMFANLSIKRDTGNLNIDLIYDFFWKMNK